MNYLTILITAIGLSMDAFSLALLYGTLDFTKRKSLEISISVGLFHFFMPIIGFYIGKEILKIIPIPPNMLIFVIFMLLAIEMFLSVFQEEIKSTIESYKAILLFSFTVSIDSFTVGIGLSSITNNLLLAALSFSLISFVFTLTGLLTGRFLNKKFGTFSTIIGSIILFILAIKYL